MFTGLVSDVGEIVGAEGNPETLRRYVIESIYPAASRNTATHAGGRLGQGYKAQP
jgi:hypothetical protein